jgi:hypothetical protein
MLFLEIYLGLCVIFFLIILLLLESSPVGWEDEDGFHMANEQENLIIFPLKKKVAINPPVIHFKFSHYQRLENENSGHPITLNL